MGTKTELLSGKTLSYIFVVKLTYLLRTDLFAGSFTPQMCVPVASLRTRFSLAQTTKSATKSATLAVVLCGHERAALSHGYFHSVRPFLSNVLIVYRRYCRRPVLPCARFCSPSWGSLLVSMATPAAAASLRSHLTPFHSLSSSSLFFFSFFPFSSCLLRFSHS